MNRTPLATLHRALAGAGLLAAATLLASGCKTTETRTETHTETRTDTRTEASAATRKSDRKAPRSAPGRTAAQPVAAADPLSQAIAADDDERLRALQAAGEFLGSEHVLRAAEQGQPKATMALITITGFDLAGQGCTLLGAATRKGDGGSRRAALLDALRGTGFDFGRCPFSYDTLAADASGAAPVIAAAHRLTGKPTAPSLLVPFKALYGQMAPQPLVGNLKALLAAGADARTVTLQSVLQVAPLKLQHAPLTQDALAEMVGLLLDAGLKPTAADIERLSPRPGRAAGGQAEARLLAVLRERQPSVDRMQAAVARSQELMAHLDFPWTPHVDHATFVRHSERAAWLIRQGHAVVDASGLPSCEATLQRVLARGMLHPMQALYDTPPAGHSGCVGHLRSAAPTGLLEQVANLGGHDASGRRCSSFFCSEAADNAPALVRLLLSRGYPHAVSAAAASPLLQSLYHGGRDGIARDILQAGKLDPVPVARNPQLPEAMVRWIAAAAGDRGADVLRAWTGERDRVLAEQRQRDQRQQQARQDGEDRYRARVQAARAAVKDIAPGDTLFWEYQPGYHLKIEAERVSGDRLQARIVEWCLYVEGDAVRGDKWCRTDYGPQQDYPLGMMRWFNRGELLKWQP